MATGKTFNGTPFLETVLVTVAFAFAAFLPSRADTYQYIVTPGYEPEVAATNGCSVALSAVSALATGAVPVEGIASGETSSRYRTSGESNVSSLNSFKWRCFSISFR